MVHTRVSIRGRGVPKAPLSEVEWFIFAMNDKSMKMSASELSMSTSSMNSSSSSSSSPQRVSRRSSLFQKMFRRGSSQKKLQQEEVCVAELCVQDLRYIPRYHEPLQYNRQEVMKRERRQSLRRTYSPDSVLDEFTHGTLMALPQKKKQVTFQEDVVVVPIPLRDDYSNSLRAKLWSNIVERCDNEGKRSLYLCINFYSYAPSDPSISTNHPIFCIERSFSSTTERNLIEFVSEDNDWRRVCLEEEMYTCSETQELIHPVHVETKLYTICANKPNLRRKSSLPNSL